MPSTPESRLNLLYELIRIPSISATPEEDKAASFIYNWLSKLVWFKEHPEYLAFVPTPLDGDNRPLHAVAAFVAASKETAQTIILTGHFDVVDVEVFGDLQQEAFEPEKLSDILAEQSLEEEVAADLASGKFIFGRGSMDMKAGVVVEMELLADFSENRDLFEVNLLLLLVPDEENLSAGMRGAIPWLFDFKSKYALDFLAAINAEPTEAGKPDAKHPAIFLGTVGKIMPAFLCIGRESHVGDYYKGVSAALMAAHIVTLAEGNPELADPAYGECCPAWICLEQRLLRENYSVTVPGAAIVYFNCFLSTRSPADVLGQMQKIALQAAETTKKQILDSLHELTKVGLNTSGSHYSIKTYSVAEIEKRAIEGIGRDAFNNRFEAIIAATNRKDPREAGISVLHEMTKLAGDISPCIIYGFLPPFYPPASSLDAEEKKEALVRAAQKIIDDEEDSNIESARYFTGICDLSYLGCCTPDLQVFAENMPGYGSLYSLPAIMPGIPIVNFGPSGRDPHKKYERLDKEYSFKHYPRLLAKLIRAISAKGSGR